MPYAKCLIVLLLASAALAAAANPPAEAPPPVLARPAGGTEPAAPTPVPPDPRSTKPGPASPAAPAEDVEQAYKDATVVLEIQIDTVQASPTVDPRLVWEAQGPVLDVLKGNLLPGRVSIHVDSVVRAFDAPRAEVVGKQFIVPLKYLGPAAQRRFQLVGTRGYPADSAAADRLRKLAESDIPVTPASQQLDLTIEPIEKVFPIVGPKVIKVTLTNKGQDSATYLQAPVTEKDGRLYLPGSGRLHIRTTSGKPVPDKGNVTTGLVPPPPPQPALILPGATFVETIDLDKYYTLPAGRYTLAMTLETPDGKGGISSNAFTFQVGALNLPEQPETAGAPEKPTDTGPGVASPSLTVPLSDNAKGLPDPNSYKPGDASFGLAALLRPTKAVYALGEPVAIEFRLINTGPRTLAVDTRLERTLTIRVAAEGDSPQPLTVRQVIPWPDDKDFLPEQRAYLRPAAFWGRTINLNSLYGKSATALEGPTAKEITEGKSLKYERFGRNLFGFTKPGTYTISASYTVSTKPSSPDRAPPEGAQAWWTGNAQTNSITIRIVEKK